MRMPFQSTMAPRRMAKMLKRAANAHDVDMKLCTAQNQIARMLGYRSYRNLHSALGQGGSGIAQLRLDDVMSVVARRLAHNNDWSEEFAQRLCDPLRSVLEGCLRRATSASRYLDLPSVGERIDGGKTSHLHPQPNIGFVPKSAGDAS